MVCIQRAGLIVVLSLIMASVSFAIVGGQTADPYRSQASVYLEFSKTRESCTGVIVHRHLILTASHCFQGVRRGKEVAVQVTNQSLAGAAKTRKFTKWGTHPRHFMGRGNSQAGNVVQYDLAYLYSDEDLYDQYGISESAVPRVPKDLQETKEVIQAVKTAAMAYGYGMTRPGDNNTLAVRKKEVVMSSDYLEASNVVQAANPSRAGGTCQGDSGGGLFVSLPEGPMLLGVLSGMSAGAKCGSSSAISYYAPLYFHLDWIRQETGIDLLAR